MMFARAPFLHCACRWPKAGMVGHVSGLASVAHRSSSPVCSSRLSVSVAGKRDSDVRIQKRGILLQERGFMFQSGKGGAHRV